MAAKKKKEKIKKAKQKMRKTESETVVQTSESSNSNTGSQECNVADVSTESVTLLTEAPTHDSKTNSSIQQDGSSSVQTSERLLKKKKKKRLTIAEVEKNFQPFDYAAAEKELFKSKFLVVLVFLIISASYA